MSSTISTVLWPLYLHDTKTWGSQEYSYLLFARSLLSIFSMALIPSIELRWGKINSIFAMASLGILTSFAFFFQDLSDSLSTILHIVISLSFFSVVSALETSLKSLASLNTPPSLVASAFGVLALLGGAGNILGNLLGTYFYTVARTSEGLPFFLAGARLPFLFVALLLTGSIACVSISRRIPGESIVKNNHIQ